MGGRERGIERSVEVPIGAGKVLHGDLALPSGAEGIVVFVHGSGSSRHSPRNRFVAQVLGRAGLGTLLFDLLTEREERGEQAGGMLRFDIGVLADRLLAVTRWLDEDPETAGHAIGFFGASTGAAGALVAAARRGGIAAIVSRGGRPDLAGEDVLRATYAPTLLLVGGEDDVVIELNREAYEQLGCERRLEIVPGATHLFEEPGTLEHVAERASEWFVEHLHAARAGSFSPADAPR